MQTITTYPFDPTGQMVSNLVPGEQHIITANNWRDYHFIVPKYAPYYMDTLQITYQDLDGVQHFLTKGVDWYESHEFISASRGCAKPIFGSISFLNTSLAGVVTISYQTIGGIWVQDEQKITEILADVLHNPRTTTWEEVIDMPYAFPPIDHEWDLVDMVGASAIVKQLNLIEEQLRSSGQNGLAAHMADVKNPHKVDANQVGLGNVRNLGTATKADAQLGSSDNVYLTPWSASVLVQSLFGVNLTSHVTDTGNPHHTTAAQVGAYSTQQSDSLLRNKLDVTAVAADSSKFNGMLPAEYAAQVLTGTAANSTLFAGRTYLELLSDMQGGASANALQFNGMDAPTYKDYVLGSGTAYNAARFGGVLYADFLKNIANATVLNAQNFNNLTYAQAKADILSGTAANAASFGGMTPANYAINVLLGTAANAAKVGGMTPAQLSDYILSTGTASNATLFGGMSTADYKGYVLASGRAADSTRLNGMLPNDFATQVLSGTAADSTKFAGLSQSDWNDTISAAITTQAANQTKYAATTGESTRTNYQVLGTVQMPSATDALSLYPDAFWLVSGGDSAGSRDSSLYLVRINTRDTIGSIKMDIKLLSGDGSSATFGYRIQDGTATGTPSSAVIWISTMQNMAAVSVTDLTGGNSDVTGTSGNTPQTGVPTGYVAVNGPYQSFIDSSVVSGLTSNMNLVNTEVSTLTTNLGTVQTQLTQMQTDVAAAFDSLTTAFTTLQASIGA